MNSIQYSSVLNENEKILHKLLAHLVNRWIRVVDRSITDNPSDDEADEKMSKTVSETNYPTFADFCKFLKKEARIACNPVTFQHLGKDEANNKTISTASKSVERA